MSKTRSKAAAAVTVLALLAGACGSDREKSSDTTAAPAVTTAATEAPDGTTAETTAATDAATETSTATEETTAASEETTPVTEAAPDVPMFGDAPWPCGPGSGANADDGSEVGVTADSIIISGGDDAGYAGAPGLDHEATDAMKALVARCNDLGGINGRQITFNYIDAGVFNVTQAMQTACDNGSFFLVGEAWAFDGSQEEARLGCGLPAVPTFAVSAAFSMGKDVFNGIPNPADESPAGYFAMMAEIEPDAIKNVGTIAAEISSTIEPLDKTLEISPNYGWGFSITNLHPNPVGEADWTPFVKQLQDAGSTAVYYVGTCLPAFQLFKQTADANGLDVPMFADTNFYEAACAAANTDGSLDGLYVHMAFIPFEEADVNPATQDYLDLLADAGGDTSLLGAQATSSFLLWATAASACGDTLTRECTLQNLSDTHAWTGHGLHAEGDPGGNHTSTCRIVLQLQGNEYVRIAPEERGTYRCDPTWAAKVVNAPALAAAKLDENRISQQFAAAAG